MKTLIGTFLALNLLCASSGNVRAQTSNELLLETLGATSAGFIYNTYLAIGSIGDAYENGNTSAEDVKALMEEQVGLLRNLEESYSNLLSSGEITNQSDKDYIIELRETFSTLRMQADALITYAMEGGVPNADRFQEHRNKAWSLISDLMGLDE